MISSHEILANEQKIMSQQVVIPEKAGYTPQENHIILALDIQYNNDEAHVAGDLLYWKGEHIKTCAGVTQAQVPYVPSYFCFREGPPLLDFINYLEQEETLPKPDVIVVDGHGIAHPRFFGVACWIGVKTQIPTIGCAKDTLVRYEGVLGEERGSTIDVFVQEKHTGYVLRTQDGIKPIFVSPGHLVSLETSVDIIMGLPSEYRVPEPLRKADHAARAHCKGISEVIWTDLGELT